MKNKLSYIILLTAVGMSSCSSEDSTAVNPDIPEDKAEAVVFAGPGAIATRSTTSLQSIGRYNFGMFAFKEQSSSPSATGSEATMSNFLVGYDDGSGKHYSPASASTWAREASDGKSPWFYEGLDGQPLVYWDKSYPENAFYYYSPYRQKDTVTVDNSSQTMTVSGGILSDGYSNAVEGSPYDGKDAANDEFLYGRTTVQRTDYGENVSLPFNHFNAQVQLGFCSAMDKYYVEIADLDADGGRMKDGTPDYEGKGIQATPAACTMNSNGTVASVAADKASYTTGYGSATIKFDGSSVTENESPKESDENLMFRIPDTQTGNLTEHEHDNIVHYCIAEKAADGSEQTYSNSPTVYYAMPQSQDYTDGKTAGLTLHLTLRLIPKSSADSADHKVTTIHNASIYIPPYTVSGSTREPLTMWQSGRRYVYHFRITNSVSGSTDPAEVIDPSGTNPTKGIELVDFDVYVPDPVTHTYRRTTIPTITTGIEDPDLPADSKRNLF